MTPAVDILLDNPILVKHIRSRLRARQLVPAIVIVATLCLSIVWMGQAGLVLGGTALAMLLGLQVLLLVFMGAAQIGTAVSKARESGIIDFHRVSPLPPSWLTVGFFYGPPILEYVLLGITLPFALWLGRFAPAGIFGVVQLMIALVLFAWIMHALALMSSMVTKKARSMSTRSAISLVIILALFLGQPLGFGLWFVATRLQGAPTLAFFGVAVHWLILIAAYALAITATLLVASTRKLRSDRTHAYSKPLAVGCQLLIALLSLGAVWDVPWNGRVLIVLYLLIAVTLGLIVTITPDRNEYVKGLRRAFRMDQRRPSPWSDAGVTRPVILLFCAVVFVSGTAILRLTVADPAASARASLAIALGVFVVAYFGLGLQYFLLRLPTAGMTIMALFVFLVWLVPVLIGSISFAVGNDQTLSQIILALSPVTGIAMSSGLLQLNRQVADAARLAALFPAITFAVIFNILYISLRRKIDLAVRTAEGKKPAATPLELRDERTNQASDSATAPVL